MQARGAPPPVSHEYARQPWLRRQASEIAVSNRRELVRMPCLQPCSIRTIPMRDQLPLSSIGSPTSMPALNRRQATIVQKAQVDGFVSIDGLTAALGVTPQTIRRDINMLCEQGILRRYHGGASLQTSTRNIDYSSRRELMCEEKSRIGQLVARHIPDGASLFLNIGTTTEAVAKALLGHRGLRVITNNLNVAMLLSQGQDFEITVAGGRLRKPGLS